MFLAWIGEAVTVMDNKGEKKEMWSCFHFYIGREMQKLITLHRGG